MGSNFSFAKKSTEGSSAVSVANSNVELLLELSNYLGEMVMMNVSGAPINLNILALSGKVKNKANTDIFKVVIIVGMISLSGMIEYIPIWTFQLKLVPSRIEFKFSDNGGFSLDLFAEQGSMEKNVRSVKCESGDYAIIDNFFSFCRVSESPVDPVAPVCLVSPLAQLDPLEVSSINLLPDNWSTLTQLNLVCGSGSATVCANGGMEHFLDKNLELVVSQNSSLSCCAAVLEDQHRKYLDINHNQQFDVSEMTAEDFNKELSQMLKIWREEKNQSNKDQIRLHMKNLYDEFNSRNPKSIKQ